MDDARVTVSCCPHTYMVHCPVQGCTYRTSKVYRTPSSLQTHLRNKHTIKKACITVTAARCPYCAWRVIDREDLRNHVSALHPTKSMPVRSLASSAAKGAAPALPSCAHKS